MYQNVFIIIVILKCYYKLNMFKIYIVNNYE